MTIAKSLALLCMWLMLIAVIGLVSWEVVQAAGEPKTLDRELEPVVVRGGQVSALIDAPVQYLFVYTFTGSGLGGQIPVQVDEMTSSGSYVSSEDGLLDTNDEIVFMTKDLGNRATDTTALTNTLPISAAWYEIEVTDPLSPTRKGWAYLVRSGSSTLTHPSLDYVIYAAPRITGSNYTLDVATAHAGLNSLTLNGNNTNILDRTKLRVTLSLFGSTVTEEAVSSAPVLVKDGPVRVILQQTATAAAGLASLSNTYLAYASLLQTTVSVSSSLTLAKVRTSIDLSSAASGATFYNANMPGGINIDGNSDSVLETPLSKWFQVSHNTGRMIQVTDLSQVGGNTQKNYYCDDNSGVSECDGTAKTGDGVSYGDAGFLIQGNVNKVFTTRNGLFILPAGSENVGALYEAYFFNSLSICPGLQANPCPNIFLPIILKGN